MRKCSELYTKLDFAGKTQTESAISQLTDLFARKPT